jgi:hypothetical protein
LADSWNGCHRWRGAIERKLDKETFQMYLTQQAKQDEALKALITSRFDGIDKRLERIENHKGD